jgi:hypothetical protein
MITVLTETTQVQCDATPGDALWISASDVATATGWQLKPEGLCKDDLCTPVPKGAEAEYLRGGQVNLSAFWTLMGKPAVASSTHDVWALGEGADARNEALRNLTAPDFTLPDFNGKPHSLTDFRRKRVLLITWASW